MSSAYVIFVSLSKQWKTDIKTVEYNRIISGSFCGENCQGIFPPFHK